MRAHFFPHGGKKCALGTIRPLTLASLVAAFALGAVLSSALGQTKTAPTAVRDALAETSHVQGAPRRTLVLSRAERLRSNCGAGRAWSG